MCPDCGKQKMLFNTEKEAERFLKFNGDEINPDGKREMRIYYCPACCGYHISSHKYNGTNKTEKLIAEYHKSIGSEDGSFIGAYELCDELKKLNFETRSEVNKYLRSRTDISDRIKDKARICYYEIKGLSKKK